MKTDRLLGKSCSLGLPKVVYTICLFYILTISCCGFDVRILVFTMPVPGHGLFTIYYLLFIN